MGSMLDGMMYSVNGTDAEGVKAVRRNGALDEKSNTADVKGIKPNKRGDKLMVAPDNPPAEVHVNTMPSHWGAVVSDDAPEVGSGLPISVELGRSAGPLYRG